MRYKLRERIKREQEKETETEAKTDKTYVKETEQGKGKKHIQ